MEAENLRGGEDGRGYGRSAATTGGNVPLLNVQIGRVLVSSQVFGIGI